MPTPPSIRLPRQWPRHVKAGMIHAIALASTALVAARGRVTGRHRLRAELDRATEEIALLREELDIKDGRWRRSRTRRRPHYSPEQRMRILQLRAARSWTMDKTARTFLIDLHTLQLWMRRLHDHDDSGFLQTSRPVNRFPDFVRVLVRELKRQLRTVGTERMAQLLARCGLAMSAATVRRVIREPFEPPSRAPEAAGRMRRRAVARKPGDVWHVDLTSVPMKAGFWTPSFPFSLPQRWPFCWWVAVIVDQMSRTLVGFAVFKSLPTSAAMQRVLDRAIAAQGRPPRCKRSFSPQSAVNSSIASQYSCEILVTQYSSPVCCHLSHSTPAVSSPTYFTKLRSSTSTRNFTPELLVCARDRSTGNRSRDAQY